VSAGIADDSEKGVPLRRDDSNREKEAIEPQLLPSLMPVPLRAIVRCPECASRDVVYSCDPKCCFNHVCANCRTTFQLNTTKTGTTDRAASDVLAPESGDPTTSCCACHSLRVAALNNSADSPLVCGECNALLKLEIEDVVSGAIVPQ
jgi:hypothetical protein